MLNEPIFLEEKDLPAYPIGRGSSLILLLVLLPGRSFILLYGKDDFSLILEAITANSRFTYSSNERTSKERRWN